MTIFETGIFIIIHIMFVHHLRIPIEASIAETITLITGNQDEKIIGPKRFPYRKFNS